MPRYGLDNRDMTRLDVFVDGVKQKYCLWADTDDGFAVVYVVDPAPTSKQPERMKIRLDKDNNPITETIWGKVEVKNKTTGGVHK